MITTAFGTFSRVAARAAGHPIAFMAAAALIVAWAATGPLFHFHDTWQLVINTATTIITFLMVFLIQHTQNRDTLVMQLKLDELIRVSTGAHNALIGLEDLEEPELERILENYRELAVRARESVKRGEDDTECGDITPAP